MGTVNQRSRRNRVLTILENQLKTGVKTQKGTSDLKVEITEFDKKRINKEITNLKNKI